MIFNNEKRFCLFGAFSGRMETTFATLEEAIEWAKKHGTHLPLQVLELKAIVNHGDPVVEIMK